MSPKKAKRANELPYIPLGPFQWRIPGIHYRVEYVEFFQGLKQAHIRTMHFLSDMRLFLIPSTQYLYESQTDMHPVMPALQLMISLNTFSDLQMKAPFSLAMQQAIPVMYRMTKQTL